jgi:hypothetical protein
MELIEVFLIYSQYLFLSPQALEENIRPPSEHRTQAIAPIICTSVVSPVFCVLDLSGLETMH